MYELFLIINQQYNGNPVTKKYLLVLHYAESHASAFLINKKGAIFASASQSIEGREAEYAPLEVIYAVRSAIHKCLKQKGASPYSISAIGLTVDPQMCLFWDKDTGLPISQAVSGKSQRNEDDTRRFSKKTGILLDYRAAGPKWKWLIENEKEVADAVKIKRARAGTIDSWILYHLTGRHVHATDWSTASETMILDFKTLHYDPFLKKEFSLPKSALPDLSPSVASFGKTQGFVPLPDGIPITALASEKASGLVGMQANRFGEARLTFANQGQLTLNMGAEPSTFVLASDNVAHYGQCIDIPFPNALMRLSRGHDLSDQIEETQNLAQSVNDAAGLSILATSTGASLMDVGADATSAHVVRAIFETIAYQIRSTLLQFEQDTGIHIKEIRADGPISKSNFVMQYCADILQIPVLRFQTDYPAILGMALLMSPPGDLQKNIKVDRSFQPLMDPISSFAKYNEWRQLRDQIVERNR